MTRHMPACLSLAVAMAAAATGQVEFYEESFQYDHGRPAIGTWLGNVERGQFPLTWAALRITSGDAGAYTAAVTLLSAGAVNAPCTDVEIDGRSVAFVLPSASGRFQGRVSDDGQRLAGTITLGDGEESEGFFEFARTPRAADLPDPLAFSGVLESSFGNLAMTMVFAETPGGNWVGQIDVPAQGLVGMPLLGVRREGNTITAELGIPVNPAMITVELSADAQRLTGRFKQGPFDLEIDFPRDVEYAEPAFNRPQHPKPPYPYAVREISIGHPDGHMLAGTLSMPPGAGPFPAVVLISGSGPQDRDETILGHKPFLVIADYLARREIAVLRCDDRGTADSTGSFPEATTADFATDVLAAMRFLSTVDGIDPGRIGLVGHSEGGMIAPMVAGLTDDVDFMVLLAGTGVRGDEILLLQAELLARAGGADEAVIAANRVQQDRLFEIILGGAPDGEVEYQVRQAIRGQMAAIGLEGEQLDTAVDGQATQFLSPWMRFFLAYDPRPALARVRCPVLALAGTLDLQVYHDQNLPEIERAVTSGGGDVTIRRYEGLNHLFQPAATGAIGEYASIETTFDERVLRDIVQWIHAGSGS